MLSADFNPRTPVGCDPVAPQYARLALNFNPRTPVGCDAGSLYARTRGHNFNPRTPVGCDRHRRTHGQDHEISIHAPQWGATGGHGDPGACARISIHAPQWGATIPTIEFFAHEIISIHAPQWGATINKLGDYLLKQIFQSTHPSGVRRTCAPPSYFVENFNPRTPVGCDEGHFITSKIRIISIHAPQWGATRWRRHFIRLIQISIHAPQWGATARMGIAFHNMEAPSVLKTDFIAKIHVHRSIHKFSNQKHQQTIHF